MRTLLALAREKARRIFEVLKNTEHAPDFSHGFLTCQELLVYITALFIANFLAVMY